MFEPAAPAFRRSLVTTLVTLALGWCPSSAAADELFVDPVSGDDGTGDGSAAAPWRTLSFAFTQLPGGPNRVRIAPGLLSEESGEQWPLVVPAGAPLELFGDPAGGTVLGSPAGTGAVRVEDPAPSGSSAPARVRIGDLTVDGIPVQVNGSLLGVRLELERVHFVDVPGVALAATSFFGDGAFVEGARCRFERCGAGVRASGTSGGISAITLSDGALIDCGVGASVDGFSPSGLGGSGEVTLTRCEVRGCGVGADVFASAGSLAFFRARDTLVAQNQVGLRGEGPASFEFERSTLAGNAVALEALGGDPGLVWLIPSNSNLWGNGVEPPPANVLFAQWSNLPFDAPGPGTTQLDPRFVDAAGGDFHLRADSPLRDLGDPFAVLPALVDPDLDPRRIDGDGDGRARIDMGHDEWNPVRLALEGAPTLGGVATFTLSAPGPSNGALFAALAPAEVSLGAPGAALIAFGSSALVAVVPTPAALTVPIPADPTLEGLTLYLQAVLTDGLALGLTNRVELTVGR